MIEGLGPDTPVTTGSHGGRQSDIPYRCDLFDGRAMLELGKVLKRGADKYGIDNWRQIPEHEHVNHALTHLFGWLACDKQDDHLEHAFCRLMMAVAIKHTPQPEIDRSNVRAKVHGPLTRAKDLGYAVATGLDELGTKNFGTYFIRYKDGKPIDDVIYASKEEAWRGCIDHMVQNEEQESQ